jgi:RNA polymerase sigma-70 factor (ECF subfamily)
MRRALGWHAGVSLAGSSTESRPVTEASAINPERWLDEHGDVLLRVALARLNDVHAAEDVVQETLVGALAGRERYAGRASERNWLMGILKHKIVDQLRRRPDVRRESDLDDSGEGDGHLDHFFDRTLHWRRAPITWSDPAGALEREEFWEVFERCFGYLPSRWAAAFRMRVLDRLSVEEARSTLGVTPTNMGVLLHRARLRLRECLELNWFGLPSGGARP